MSSEVFSRYWLGRRSCRWLLLYNYQNFITWSPGLQCTHDGSPQGKHTPLHPSFFYLFSCKFPSSAALMCYFCSFSIIWLYIHLLVLNPVLENILPVSLKCFFFLFVFTPGNHFYCYLSNNLLHLYGCNALQCALLKILFIKDNNTIDVSFNHSFV